MASYAFKGGLLIDGTGKAVATLPGPYFAQHYTVIQV